MPALAILLHESAPFESGEEPTDGRLVEVKGVREIGHGGGAVGLGEADEQRCRTIDRPDGGVVGPRCVGAARALRELVVGVGGAAAHLLAAHWLLFLP